MSVYIESIMLILRVMVHIGLKLLRNNVVSVGVPSGLG